MRAESRAPRLTEHAPASRGREPPVRIGGRPGHADTDVELSRAPSHTSSAFASVRYRVMPDGVLSVSLPKVLELVKPTEHFRPAQTARFPARVPRGERKKRLFHLALFRPALLPRRIRGAVVRVAVLLKVEVRQTAHGADTRRVRGERPYEGDNFRRALAKRPPQQKRRDEHA